MLRALVGRNLVGGNLVKGIHPSDVGNPKVGNLTGFVGNLGMVFNDLEQEEDKLLFGFYSRRCGDANNMHTNPLTECLVQIRYPL